MIAEWIESLNLELAERSLNVKQLQSQQTELADECLQLEEAKHGMTAQVEAANNNLLEIHRQSEEQKSKLDALIAEQVSLSHEYELLVEANKDLVDRNSEAELEAERLSQLKNDCLELELQIEFSKVDAWDLVFSGSNSE